jgi:hypothetical protein
VAAAAVLLAGCGLGPGEARKGGAELRVTRDFGHVRLYDVKRAKLRESDTVMRFLRAQRKVDTRYGGRFVQAIDGLEGSQESGSRDWFFFVNGFESEVGAAERKLEKGDVVQWDYRRWDGAMRVPAIVGAYPEPFVHGIEGKRLPVRVECADPGAGACSEVKDRLDRIGARPGSSSLGVPASDKVLRVVVGKWSDVRAVRAAATIEKGPSASGVFARLGRSLQLLDEQGRVVRDAPPGSGLLAATRREDEGVVWVVTGLDDAGVDAAAAALDEPTLRDAFAVAATPDGVVRLPVMDRESEG